MHPAHMAERLDQQRGFGLAELIGQTVTHTVPEVLGRRLTKQCPEVAVGVNWQAALHGHEGASLRGRV